MLSPRNLAIVENSAQTCTNTLPSLHYVLLSGRVKVGIIEITLLVPYLVGDETE